MKKKKRSSRTRKVNTKNWGQRGESIPLPATISVPSGRCPFVMEEDSREAVLEWIARVTHDKASPLTYMQSVYKYWVRHSFDMHTESASHKKASLIIEEVVPEYTKATADLLFNASEYLGD